MKTKPLLFFTFLFFNWIMTACAPAQTSTQTVPIDVPPINSTLPASTAIQTDIASPQTTQTTSPNGLVIYDDGKDILAINPDTGEIKILISRAEVELIINKEDKSAQSYTFGYKKPIDIKISPDFTKALITMCTSLDIRFRCIFEDYIFSLEQKIAIRIQSPPETYGIYWQWSPDNSALAGAAWNYMDTTYQVTRFYTINSDGTGLQSLIPVTNEHWQFAWNPSSKVIHPLTFITNFQSVYTDGSRREDILISELEWNEKVECLSFSSDHSQVAFVISKELPKDHDWLYIARSDFTNILLINEFDIDTRYSCELSWSPDQSFLHIGYQHEARRETGEVFATSDILPATGKVFEISTGNLIQPSTESASCIWSPAGDIVFQKKSFAGEEAGIELFNLASASFISLPAGLQNTVGHCPLVWLKEAPAVNVPIGIPILDACRPDATLFFDAEESSEAPIPFLFDAVYASASLDGENLIAKITLKDVATDFSSYITPNIPPNFPNGWEILIDVDNNALTGDPIGIEYRFSTGVVLDPASGSPTLGRVVLRFDSTSKSYVKVDTLAVLFAPETDTITFTGKISGISSNSRLLYISRLVDKMTDTGPNVITDTLCN